MTHAHAEAAKNINIATEEDCKKQVGSEKNEKSFSNFYFDFYFCGCC